MLPSELNINSNLNVLNIDFDSKMVKVNFPKKWKIENNPRCQGGTETTDTLIRMNDFCFESVIDQRDKQHQN